MGHRFFSAALALVCLLFLGLGACGGGGSTSADSGGARGSPGATDTAAPSTTTSTTTTTTLPPIGSTLTTLQMVSTSSAPQTNLPVTFGQVFPKGEFPASAGLTAVYGGTQVPLQVNVKATHADGSVRHAILSAVLPQLSNGQTQPLELATTPTANAYANNTPAALLASGFTATVDVTVGGQTYRIAAHDLLQSGAYTTWLSGPEVNEWIVFAPLKKADNTPHPALAAQLAIRHYPATNKTRVDVVLENSWTYEQAPQNYTYDVDVKVRGQSVYSKAGLTHFRQARWRKTFWGGAETGVHIKHQAPYLIASKAIPNYDQSITVAESALNTLAVTWAGKSKEPMASGVLQTAMGTAGGRPDIGPLPQWAAMYVLSMDKRAKDVTIGSGDLAASWPIHYRDKNTSRPLTIAEYPYVTILGRLGDSYNPATKQYEMIPACGGDCSTAPYNYAADSSHQPMLAFVPYLVTGDYFYLEELHFWANWNLIQANPYYRGFSKGTLQWDQVRGQAWSLRTLAQAAYITPDDHPIKTLLNSQVEENLAFYNANYSNANPNQLGFIGREGQYAFNAYAYNTWAGPQTGIAPWMDDFFTWSIGYLVELDFANAKPLLAWKAKFPIGRMTAPGYCWIDGATYTLVVRPATNAALYTTFADAYQATMKRDNGAVMSNSTGNYLDKTCGSQLQADWRTQDDIDARVARTPWSAGEMTGYAFSEEGFPSNMQPALAVAATSGVPNAQNAWNIFISRSIKPNYANAPQWAIVPRN